MTPLRSNSTARAPLAAWVFGLLGVAGCGSNAPEIPDYLANRGSGDCSCDAGGTGGANDYPKGPYGVTEGAIVENVRFAEGWRDPAAAERDPARLEVIEFADFYDPEGERTELLLVNTTAVWCQSCKVEHKDLPKRYAELHGQGLEILSGLFQDGDAEPAALKDLSAWARQFGTNFPFVLDPEFQLGRFGSAATTPLNVVIDARTMRVLRLFVGDQGAVMWPFIQGELDARAGH